MENEDNPTPEETSTEAPQDGASSISGDNPANEAITEEAAPIKPVGKVWEVVVIREGWSLNNRYYTREALETSVPLWEGEDVCMYGSDPHRDRNHVEPSVERVFPHGTYANKVGVIRNVRGRVTEGRFELVAEFVCTKPDVRTELLETFEATGRMPGFSIHADGDLVDGLREGRRGRIVTAITATKELTLVSKPAAGGRAFRLVAGLQNPKEGVMLATLRKFIASRLPKSMAALTEGADEKHLTEAAKTHLKEMAGSAAAKALAYLEAGEPEKAQVILELLVDEPMEEPEEMAPADDLPMESNDTVEEGRAQKMVRRMEVMECRNILREALKEADLPQVAEDQIKAEFSGKVFEEKALQESIKQKKALLSVNAGGEALIESAPPRHPQVSVLVESQDTMQGMMNLFMGYDWRKDESLTESEKDMYRSLDGAPATRSIKRLYQEASGDWGLTHIGGKALREAVNNTTFSNSLGTSITLMLQHDFSNMPTPDWQGFVKEVPGETLLQRNRVIQGGIGILPTVAEGGTFQDLGQPKEYAGNYSLEKRGGYVEVTEEAILNDRIDFIRNIPNKIRNAALEAEKTLIYQALIGDLGGSGINSDTSYDSVVHYHANHDNTSTTALSNAALVNAKLLTKRQMVFATETALNDGTDINSSDTAVVVDDATGIRPGMYIRCEAEWMKVTAVSTNTLTVTRGERGSTAASHVDDTPIFSYSGMLPWEANGGFNMFVIVPTELEDEAYVALGSQFLPGGGNNDVNTLYTDYQAGRIKVVSLDSIYLGGDVNNWYTAVPWQVSPGLEFSFLNGSRVPQLINQTMEQVGQVFLADTMRYKVKHRIGANNLFHEGRTGHIVTGG